MLRKNSTLTGILLVCQLSHCLLSILLHQTGQYPTSFFFENTWTSDAMASTADFTVIHALCISTSDRDREQPMSSTVAAILVPSLRYISICTLSKSRESAAFRITRTSKRKNDSSDSQAADNYNSYLIISPPRHPDEIVAKCLKGHNVLVLQCI